MGAYGPATEARVKLAPAEGFGLGATCASARVAVELPVVAGPTGELCAH